jgi:hypothetical protein
MTTNRRRFALALGLLAAAAAPAAAQVVATTADRDVASPPPQHFWDARFGMLAGAATVGDSDGTSIGVTGGFGYHFGAFALRGELDYYRVGDDPDVTMSRRGRATRGAALLRYSFAATDSDDSVIGDLWGEAGAGYERVAWATGGVLTRPDGELALGADLGGRRDGHGPHRKRLGGFIDVRSFIAEAPADPTAPITCGGPCTMATQPPRTDVSLFFEFGVFFGR